MIDCDCELLPEGIVCEVCEEREAEPRCPATRRPCERGPECGTARPCDLRDLRAVRYCSTRYDGSDQEPTP